MRTVFAMLMILGVLTACAAPEAQATVTSMPTDILPPATVAPTTVSAVVTVTMEPTATPVPVQDVFTQMSISLPAPVCTALTQSEMEGPYYKADTPERTSLFEQGMPGTRLILVGYVVDQNCQPLPNTWLDFWQADANGEYDNAGYRLRGHQFTDAQGRYFLETILPGLYSSRPIEHIHVKVRPEGGQEITSQLYFPDQPVEGLTVLLEDRGEYRLGFFNFVVPR